MRSLLTQRIREISGTLVTTYIKKVERGGYMYDSRIKDAKKTLNVWKARIAVQEMDVTPLVLALANKLGGYEHVIYDIKCYRAAALAGSSLYYEKSNLKKWRKRI